MMSMDAKLRNLNSSSIGHRKHQKCLKGGGLGPIPLYFRSFNVKYAGEPENGDRI